MPEDNKENKAPTSSPSTGAGRAASSSQPPPSTGAGDDKSPASSRLGRRVEVLVDNLGPKLLKAGDVTDDPAYVDLLKTARGRTLVREVK